LVKQFRTVAKGSKKPGLATPLGVGVAIGNVGRGAVIGGGIGVTSEVMGEIELAYPLRTIVREQRSTKPCMID